MYEVTGRLVLDGSNITCEVPDEVVMEGRTAVELYVLGQAIYSNIDLYDMEIRTTEDEIIWSDR